VDAVGEGKVTADMMEGVVKAVEDEVFDAVG
jgi:hypothetical protein